MYIDNLTLAGLFGAALYSLLPLLFGREIYRVEEERHHPKPSNALTGAEIILRSDTIGGQPQPCP